MACGGVPELAVAADGRHGFGAAVAVEVALGGGRDGLGGAPAVQRVGDGVCVGGGCRGAGGGRRGGGGDRGAGRGVRLEETRCGDDGGHGGGRGDPVEGLGATVGQGVQCEGLPVGLCSTRGLSCAKGDAVPASCHTSHRGGTGGSGHLPGRAVLPSPVNERALWRSSRSGRGTAPQRLRVGGRARGGRGPVGQSRSPPRLWLPGPS